MNYHDLLIHFMHQALTNNKLDLGVYARPKFCRYLRAVALQELNYALIKVNIELLYAQKLNQPTNLARILNSRKPKGLYLLDYCILAGFYDLAITLAYYGAISTDAFYLNDNISATYHNDSQPEIIKNISKILADLNEVQHNINHTSLNLNTANLQQSAFNYSKYKYALGFLGLSVGCGFASPLVHGIGGILAVSVGIPSFFAGVNALQTADSSIENKHDNKRREIYLYESQQAKHLLELARELKQDLLDYTMQINLVRPEVENTPMRTLNFAFQRSDPMTEELALNYPKYATLR